MSGFCSYDLLTRAMLCFSLSGCPLVSPTDKKILMRQEAETKLFAQAKAHLKIVEEKEKTVKLRSGRSKFRF